MNKDLNIINNSEAFNLFFNLLNTEIILDNLQCNECIFLFSLESTYTPKNFT